MFATGPMTAMNDRTGRAGMASPHNPPVNRDAAFAAGQ